MDARWQGDRHRGRGQGRTHLVAARRGEGRARRLEGTQGGDRGHYLLETGTDLLIAASADGKVQSWTLPDAKPVRELTIPGVVALGLSSDGKRLAAGRADGVVQVWNLAAGKPLIELKGDAETNAQVAALEWVVAAEGLEAAFQKQEAVRIEAQTKGA